MDYGETRVEKDDILMQGKEEKSNEADKEEAAWLGITKSHKARVSCSLLGLGLFPTQGAKAPSLVEQAVHVELAVRLGGPVASSLLRLCGASYYEDLRRLRDSW